MERYRLRANFNPNLSQTLSIQTNPPSHISLPPKTPITRRVSAADDADICVFDAERYFKETCDPLTNPRDSSVSSVDGYAKSYRSFRSATTPTLSSEASWNSQSGLLKNPPRSVNVSVRAFPLNEKRKNGLCRRFFGRNCPCYGKKSVDVEEKSAESKSTLRVGADKVSTDGSTLGSKDSVEGVAKLKLSAGIWAKDSKCLSPKVGPRIVNSAPTFTESAGFSFPILAPPLLPPPETEPAMMIRPAPRSSVPAGNETAKIRGRAEFLRRPPPFRRSDDVASDTSSDLFEIDSFSTNSGAPSPGLARRVSEDDGDPVRDPSGWGAGLTTEASVAPMSAIRERGERRVERDGQLTEGSI
ncbi:uncharacterized protein A4U43_C03F31750 [Asparagus officinalis]|uniref:Uncharacterized protein n=1 Tax=Asparagus officinalis TaxID=4686 RepID=A0A5P1FGB1_ASPOF|nr:protein PHYTOCHROME KINASE SUBSTRATE 4 [Asparagus officinalis]ONK76753.1 uncharacterized protein A4U43_C03F31750 [Asparagus officinalis]